MQRSQAVLALGHQTRTDDQGTQMVSDGCRRPRSGPVLPVTLCEASLALGLRWLTCKARSTLALKSLPT